MSEYAGPSAALKGHGFTSYLRDKDADGNVVVRWSRARTNVRLVVKVGHRAGWTAEITGTASTKAVTIADDLDALERRIAR